MPGHSTADLDRMVAGLLDASRPIRGQYSGHVTSLDQSEDAAWPQSLNNLVDTLRPEAAAPLISSAAPMMSQRPRMATLHSEVTQETVVLHAASNEDEADDDVLVVADDDHQEPVSRSHRVHDPHHDGLQPPMIRTSLNTQPDNRPQHVVKPPTYVPIPSKKDKSKTTISPSGFTANPSRNPNNISLTPDLHTSPKSRPQEIKPKPRTPPVRVMQRPLRESSTRVSRVSAAPLMTSAAPLMSDLRPRTTEIRPVTSVMEVNQAPLTSSAPPLVFPCPICHERFLGQVCSLAPSGAQGMLMFLGSLV